MTSSPSDDDSSLSFFVSLACLDLVFPFFWPPPAGDAPVPVAEAFGVLDDPAAGDAVWGEVRELDELDLLLTEADPRWAGLGGRGGASSARSGSDFGFIERSTEYEAWDND